MPPNPNFLALIGQSLEEREGAIKGTDTVMGPSEVGATLGESYLEVSKLLESFAGDPEELESDLANREQAETALVKRLTHATTALDTLSQMEFQVPEPKNWLQKLRRWKSRAHDPLYDDKLKLEFIATRQALSQPLVNNIIQISQELRALNPELNEMLTSKMTSAADMVSRHMENMAFDQSLDRLEARMRENGASDSEINLARENAMRSKLALPSTQEMIDSNMAMAESAVSLAESGADPRVMSQLLPKEVLDVYKSALEKHNQRKDEKQQREDRIRVGQNLARKGPMGVMGEVLNLTRDIMKMRESGLKLTVQKRPILQMGMQFGEAETRTLSGDPSEVAFAESGFMMTRNAESAEDILNAAFYSLMAPYYESNDPELVRVAEMAFGVTPGMWEAAKVTDEQGRVVFDPSNFSLYNMAESMLKSANPEIDEADARRQITGTVDELFNEDPDADLME